MAEKNTFPSILEEAFKLPETESQEITSPFSSNFRPAEIEAKKGPQYNYTAHIKRFIVDDGDDTANYERIINSALDGKIVIRFEERTITKDGDVVIVLSWLEPKIKAPIKGKDRALTVEELKSPERLETSSQPTINSDRSKDPSS